MNILQHNGLVSAPHFSKFSFFVSGCRAVYVSDNHTTHACRHFAHVCCCKAQMCADFSFLAFSRRSRTGQRKAKRRKRERKKWRHKFEIYKIFQLLFYNFENENCHRQTERISGCVKDKWSLARNKRELQS